VSVSGAGEVKAQPDLAYVTIGVEARKPVLNDARAEVNAAVERLLALTRELKIDPEAGRLDAPAGAPGLPLGREDAEAGAAGLPGEPAARDRAAGPRPARHCCWRRR
jgi:hypothetical protein